MSSFGSSEEEMPEPQQSGDNTIALFLGLYLLILAFFILLVSISTLEEIRTQQIMDSLSSTFSTILPPSSEIKPFDENEGDIMAGQRFQERITGIFATSLQIAKVDVVQPGRLMKVSLPVNALFEKGEAEMRNVQLELLDRIVASVSARGAGTRYDLEFVIGAEFIKGTENLPIGETLAMARAGAFAREMLSRGVPPDSVSVGMRRGDPTQVDIWFHVRDAQEALLRFEQFLPGFEETGEAGPTSAPPVEGQPQVTDEPATPLPGQAPALLEPTDTAPPPFVTTPSDEPATGAAPDSGSGGVSIPLPFPPPDTSDTDNGGDDASTGGPTDDGGFLLPPRPGG